jgi:PEP-CTERM motif
MKFMTTVVAGAILAVLASASNAASIKTLIGSEGAFVLEDDSAERHIDEGGAMGTENNGLLDIGEKLRGIVEFPVFKGFGSNPLGTDYSLDGVANEHLSAIFEVEVTGKTMVAPGVFDFTFGPSASFAAEYGGSAAGTMIKFYTEMLDNVNIAGALCQTPAQVAAGGACEGTVADGAWLMDIGFGGDADEGWEAFNAPDDTSVGALASLSSSLGTFNYNLSLLADSGLPQLLQIAANPGVGGAGDGLIDFTGSGQLLGTLNPFGTKVTGYDFTDDADLAGNAIPEPTSIALFGLTLFGLVAANRRKVK